MKLNYRIFNTDRNLITILLNSEAIKLGCPYDLAENKIASSIVIEFTDDDVYAASLKELCAQHNIRYHSGLRYEKKEIFEAEWVIAEVGHAQYPQPEEFPTYIYETYQTDSYCPRCGQGTVQNRPFRLKKDFGQGNNRFWGIHWKYDVMFTSTQVKQLLEQEGITGLTYGEVLHYKSSKPFEGIWQMHMSHLEEPGLITDNLKTVTCKPQNEESFIEGIGQIPDRNLHIPFCGRVKYHHPFITPYIFQAKVLENAPDFVQSYEYFGSGGGASRITLVRQKVVQLVKQKKLGGMGFYIPIFLV